MKIETRIYDDRRAELRAYKEKGANIIEGYAAKYNVESRHLYDNRNNRMFTEIIEPGAFRNVLKDDVYLTFNHSKDTILARTINNSLTLKEDSKGLFFRALLNNTTQANDVYEMVSRGDVTENSFGFFVNESDVKYERKNQQIPLRRISIIANLFDVSVVTKAAYPNTEVYARGLSEYLKKEFNETIIEPEEIDYVKYNNLKTERDLYNEICKKR